MVWKMERVKGFEPSTPTLARLGSTPELSPRRTQVLKHLFLLTQFISKPDNMPVYGTEKIPGAGCRPGDENAETAEKTKGGFPTDTLTSHGAG